MTVGRVVIVGAGHGGAALAGLLRQHHFAGTITLLSAEHELPYHRPPLSKKFAGPEREQPLRAPEFWAEQSIDLRLGVTVESVDRRARTVRTTDGTEIAYDRLVLATGARSRQLTVPGSTRPGVLGLRTLVDARALAGRLIPGSRVAIIGGGYVGLEVASVARSAGAEVTVLERERRLLARVASAALSHILADHHLRSGTRIHTGVDVTEILGDEKGVTGVRLGSGVRVPCDTVLVGIGAVPAEDLAVEAGLACDQGILVDSSTRTTDPLVLAIGDVTRRPVAGLDTARRLESIPSATEQARRACAQILGTTPAAEEVPWFWSDQDHLKLKIAGLVPPEATPVLRGNPDEGRFAIFHLVDGVVVAAETCNSGADFMAAKRFIADRSPVDPVLLADPAVRPADAVRHHLEV